MNIEIRRLRTVAVLWAHCSEERVTYYHWELHSPKLLADLAKVARRIPRWEDFIKVLNLSLLARHEKRIQGGRSQAIGCHASMSNVHEERSPLERCDVDMLLTAPITGDTARADSWVNRKHSKVKVMNQSVEKSFDQYPNIDHFAIEYYQNGMLVLKSLSTASKKRERR